MYYTTKAEIKFFQFLFVGLKIICTFAAGKMRCLATRMAFPASDNVSFLFVHYTKFNYFLLD